MNKQYKISIVTVCYNAVIDIEKTILSVINQRYANIEYIIIDGNSSDGTIDIIKKFTNNGSECGKHNHCVSQFISEPDKGIYDAMNKGIKMASGDYINFMNAGDSFTNDRVIENFVNELDDRESYDVVYGDVIKFNNKTKREWLDKSYEPSVLTKHGAFCHQGCFIKANLHKQIPYDTKYKLMADFDFFHKAYMQNYKFKKINLLVANYDATTGASLRNIDQNYKEMALIISDTDKFTWKLLRYLRRNLGKLKRVFTIK